MKPVEESEAGPRNIIRCMAIRAEKAHRYFSECSYHVIMTFRATTSAKKRFRPIALHQLV